MVLKGIAEQTLAIIESGRYRSEAGLEVIIGPEVARAVDGTVLYRPGDYDGIQVNASERQPVRAEVTNETTTAAARRLIRDEGAEISETPRRRALQMLTVAAHREHATLILGAWGCGVFRNDPAEVASVFAEHLARRTFAGVFARVVFAVYDRSASQSNFNAFAKQFGLAIAP
jgi:hypothetical protein